MSINRFLDIDCKETFDELKTTRLSSFLNAVGKRTGLKITRSSKHKIAEIRSKELMNSLINKGLTLTDEFEICDKYYLNNKGEICLKNFH